MLADILDCTYAIHGGLILPDQVADSSIRRKTAWTAGLSVASFLATFSSTLVISYHFGTSAELDAYWAAFAVMNLLAFPLTPLREALVPEVYRHLQNDRAAASDYFSRAMSLILLVATGGMVIGWLFADQLAALSVSARQPEVREMAVGQLYYLAPVIVLMALSETTNAMLTAFNRVVFQGFARLLGVLAALAVLAAFSGVLRGHILPLSLIAAQAVTLIVQLRVTCQNGMELRFTWPRELGVRFISMGGVIGLNAALHQIYAISEKHVLTAISVGLVSSFQYAVSISNVMVTLIGVTLASVLWPRFLDYVSTENRAELLSELMYVWRIVLLGLGGICTLVWLNAEPLIQLVYGRGAFDAVSISRTVQALQLAIFAALPASILLITGRVLISFGFARSLLATGVATTLAGGATLVAGGFMSNPSVAMLHWLLGSTTGLMVQTILLFRACSAPIEDMRRYSGWIVKWLLALIASGSVALCAAAATSSDNVSAVGDMFVSAVIFSTSYILFCKLCGLCGDVERLVYRK